jgi:large subunit ribosomal protein L9
MEIILTQDIPKLGDRGDVVRVKDGYARNFLLPKKLAMRATESNRRHFQEVMRQTRARMQKQRGTADEQRAKLDGEHVKFTLAFGETGKAYGSITSKQIAEGFREKGIYFDHHQVMLDHPLKEPGAHDVQIRLFSDIIATVKVWVVPEGESESADETVESADAGKTPTQSAESTLAPSEDAVTEETEEAEATEKAEDTEESTPEETVAEQETQKEDTPAEFKEE